MLNEIYELEQYSYEPSEYSTKYGNYRRLRIEKNDIKGQRRALQIIARSVIHKYADPYSAEAIDETRNAMSKWLYADKSDRHGIVGWLPEYAEHVYGKDFNDKAQKLEKKYRRRSISVSDNAEIDNNVNAIHFDDIICEAQCAGPLKRYYLLASNLDEISSVDGIWRNIYVHSDNDPCNPTLLTAQKQRAINKRIILRLTVAYLLDQLKGYENKLTSRVNMTDIGNWNGSSLEDNGKGSVAAVCRYYYLQSFDSVEHSREYLSANYLFCREKIDNYSLISINNQWLKHCGWQLVTDQELDSFLDANRNAYDSGHIVFFSDSNCKELLTNTRY